MIATTHFSQSASHSLPCKIGLEVHVQLNTKSKLFCSCSTTEFSDKQPNTLTCEVCLGMPGSKPRLNKQAVLHTLKLCLALNCHVTNPSYFSRKTYYYPDLSKNYQITQYETPLGTNGTITVEGTTIRIKRVHLEEDPAALEHVPNGTLIDYNRSGIPLAEIVTEPDITSPEHARSFLKKMLNTLTYLNITSSDMSIKADVNVSVAKHNYTRVEIKNVTGFKEVERALVYEIARQEREETIVQETRRWDGERTHSMRTKETEDDYGYIYDADLPQLNITQEIISKTRGSIPRLSDERIKEYIARGVSFDDADVVTQDLHVADAYELVTKTSNPVTAAKWFRKEVLKVLNAKELPATALNLKTLSDIIMLLHDKKITEHTGRDLMTHILEKDFSPREHVETSGTTMISDSNVLEQLCKTAIDSSPKAVADYKKGEEKALNAIVGHVMKSTKGTAKPDDVKKIIERMVGELSI